MQEQVGWAPEPPEIQLEEKYYIINTDQYVKNVSYIYVFHAYLALTSQTPPQASLTTAEIEKS